MRLKQVTRPNKAGAGNGAMALSFHVGRRGRAVPDLWRSAAKCALVEIASIQHRSVLTGLTGFTGFWRPNPVNRVNPVKEAWEGSPNQAAGANVGERRSAVCSNRASLAALPAMAQLGRSARKAVCPRRFLKLDRPGLLATLQECRKYGANVVFGSSFSVAKGTNQGTSMLNAPRSTRSSG